MKLTDVLALVLYSTVIEIPQTSIGMPCEVESRVICISSLMRKAMGETAVSTAVAVMIYACIEEQDMATLYGDVQGEAGSLVGNQKGKNQVLMGTDPFNELVGDAYLMRGSSLGGNDVLIVMDNSAMLLGDAYSMVDSSRGGNDVLRSSSGQDNSLVGDADAMADRSLGGNDVLWASGYLNYLNGDANDMSGSSRGGNDALTGAGSYNYLRGDAFIMRNGSLGGNDVLTGAGSLNYLYGDADALYQTSQGGGDRLVGGDGQTFMYGDAYSIYSGRGGNDTLISGSGNDEMWGDFAEWAEGTPASAFGADVFRFDLNNGTDTIHDFQQGKDKIDLSLKGITSLTGFAMTANGSDLVLSFGDNGSDGKVTIVGVSALTASDFIFATT